MTLRTVSAACLLLLGLAGTVAARDPVLSATAYGPVVFGERLDVIEARLRQKASPLDGVDEACYSVEFAAYPDVLFMVEHGRVTRAETNKPVTTAIGVTVGSSMRTVRRQAPTIRVAPHHDEEGGHYLTLVTRDGKAALLMEEVQGTVTAVRGGLVPSVQYVEGCV